MPTVGADLQVRDLVIEYSSGGYAVRPIDGLSLDAAGGELVLLLGASGCGKTTLLSVLAAILTPHAGSVSVAGVDVLTLRGATLTDYRRKTVGVVFQAFNLVPSLTAVENIMVPLRGAGVKSRVARARSVELLEQVDLGHRLTHKPSGMSGGQQQRVAIARALAHDPPVILADEPTAHLDYIQVEGVLKLLRELANGDRLVVVATHDNRMLAIADRVVELVPSVAHAERAPERVELAAGAVLFRQGDWGELIYVIESGEIEIVAELEGGKEEIRNTLGEGVYFGEAGPIFGLPRSATARARTASVVVGYTTRAFRERTGPLPIERVAMDADVVAGTAAAEG